ncbi:alpha/beta fold hydrolase [Shewanella schlegeliana]|uniref:Alpha/beta fold hydrolase n=1 Tax=Shewanella schlegeliana TaxID=190308 RepID=A0ABS1SZA6_9GAMM|nr:alpha/beta fold hydrolase [Shewanella schlegeliana]MBL4913876.1 alpha/beta fold hydrolase [Shewanella schlegeliana]MCL1108740.1 alpha/beta fold hydrolase [Shewanella schlegeliana]GIU26226.1 esterase [Shewanella schlegeliana]
MHYVTSGQGPVVILIHGLFGDLDNLKALAKALEDSFTVVRVDILNHGASPSVANMDYRSLADSMAKLIQQLPGSQAILVGHSMGGKIAMATALCYPELVSKLVIADIAPVAYESRHDKVFSALESMPLAEIKDRRQALAHMKNWGIDDGTAQFLLKSLTRAAQGFSWKMNLTGLKASYANIIDWPTFSHSYQGPCLFVRGGDSDYVSAEHRQAIITQFPTVKAKTIEGTGHWLHAQKPTIFNRIVKDFITNN